MQAAECSGPQSDLAEMAGSTKRVQKWFGFADCHVRHLLKQRDYSLGRLKGRGLAAGECECRDTGAHEGFPFQATLSDALIPGEHDPALLPRLCQPEDIGRPEWKCVSRVAHVCADGAHGIDEDARINRLVQVEGGELKRLDAGRVRSGSLLRSLARACHSRLPDLGGCRPP